MKRFMMMMAALMLAGCGCADAAQGIVSRDEFEQVFPHHSAFYTYEDFVAYAPAFADRREAAAYLANVHHETGGLAIVDEAPSMRSGYCDRSKPYGCPAGADQYFGRGPLQLSWNYNYKTAGDALGLNLIDDPGLISRDASVAWRTAAWYWDTRVPHGDFGETVRAINGAQECEGGHSLRVLNRVRQYERIAEILHTSPGDNLSC